MEINKRPKDDHSDDESPQVPCKWGADCWGCWAPGCPKRHPIAVDRKRPCKWGNDCWTEGCQMWHPITDERKRLAHVYRERDRARANQIKSNRARRIKANRLAAMPYATASRQIAYQGRICSIRKEYDFLASGCIRQTAATKSLSIPEEIIDLITLFSAVSEMRVRLFPNDPLGVQYLPAVGLWTSWAGPLDLDNWPRARVFVSSDLDDWANALNLPKGCVFRLTQDQSVALISIVERQWPGIRWSNDINTHYPPSKPFCRYKWVDVHTYPPDFQWQRRRDQLYERLSDGHIQAHRPPIYEPVVPLWIARRNRQYSNFNMSIYVPARTGVGELGYENRDMQRGAAREVPLGHQWVAPTEFQNEQRTWMASLDLISGRMYYEHIDSGHIQLEPPKCFVEQEWRRLKVEHGGDVYECVETGESQSTPPSHWNAT